MLLASFYSLSKTEGLLMILVFQTKTKQGIDSSHNSTSLAFNCNQQLASQKESNLNEQSFRKHVLQLKLQEVGYLCEIMNWQGLGRMKREGVLERCAHRYNF